MMKLECGDFLNSKKMTEISLETAQSRQLIDTLRSLGLDKFIELPQIVAMGDTSSGKSSLLSALSGITFPSSEKLTTRCPTQLILNNHPKFSGTVRLQRYNQEAKKNSQEQKIDSIDDITKAIERFTAQLVDEGQSISDDAIVIKVQGPAFPNLTLTDLPGLIRTVSDGEDPAMIPRVRALIKRYLVQKRTIILAVNPANVDIHNSEILNAAQEADPAGERTICVLTKPDLVDEGAEESVMKLLQNQVVNLKLGFHAVKCRGQKALNKGVSIAEGLVHESSFFETHPIWKDIDKNLLGIPTLTEKLMSLLQNHIANALPDVIEEIDQLLKKAKTESLKLGAALETDGARRAFFNNAIERYLEILRLALEGDYDGEFFLPQAAPDGEEETIDNRLRASLRSALDQFANVMAETKIEETYTYPKDAPNVGDYVQVYDGEEWSPSRVTEVNGDTIQTRHSEPDEYLERWTQQDLSESEWTWRHKPVLDLSKLKEEIRKNRGNELKIFPSFKIFRSIVRKYVARWDSYVQDLVDRYMKLTTAVSDRAMSHIARGKISQCFRQISRDCLDAAYENSKKDLYNALEQEKTPFTLNHYLEDILMKLRNEDLIESIESIEDEDFSKNYVLSILKSYGVGTDSADDREAIEMNNALKAYVKVMRKRFTDKVPLVLEQSFIAAFVNDVSTRLRSIGDVDLVSLLSESQTTINHRKHLEFKIDSLEKAKRAILGLGI